jgi:beta-N-acetylhexosaminidase
MKKKAVLVTMIILSLLTGCFGIKDNNDTTEKIEATTTEEPNVIQPEELDEVTLDGLTNDIVKNMTLKQKLGQMFIVNLDLLDTSKGDGYGHKMLSHNMKKSIKKYSIGGVIFFSKNIKNEKQTKKFIKQLQKSSSMPMFVSVDEEGGSVSRLGTVPAMKVTKFDDMNKIGATGDSTKAKEIGDVLGEELDQLGFNMNFAPVADVYSNPKSGMKERCFSADKEVVAAMVKEEVKAMQKHNVSATLKHFPGIGGSNGDTHLEKTYCTKTIKQLRKKDFIPFQAGIDAGVDCVMISHVVLNKVQEEEEPSSVSKLVVTDILRNELDFDGLVITDAFNMKAITNEYHADEAAVAAVQAGVDVVLMPENLGKAYKGLHKAVKKGTITEERIDQSVKRIIRTKLSRGVISLDSEPIK